MDRKSIPRDRRPIWIVWERKVDPYKPMVTIRAICSTIERAEAYKQLCEREFLWRDPDFERTTVIEIETGELDHLFAGIERLSSTKDTEYDDEILSAFFRDDLADWHAQGRIRGLTYTVEQYEAQIAALKAEVDRLNSLLPNTFDADHETRRRTGLLRNGD